MEKLFNPKSIAIIGASRHEEKLGYQILNNILSSGYKGNVYPVNPKAKEILGLRCFGDVLEIPSEIDLAIIVVPAPFVPEVLNGCIKKNVAYATIISSGFSEIGPKGKILQDEIIDVVIKTSPLRVLGPNCLGLINTGINLNATFAAPKLVKGNVSAIFQSGALGVALLDWAKEYEFGFAKFISLGNKVDIDETEILEFLEDDPETHVITMYLESISNMRKFLDVARRVSQKKPIIILKGGMTKMGAKAAFSHTAAMITPTHINNAIFSQANLMVAETIEEMLNLIQIVSCEPPVTEKKIGIITNAGGPAIITADAISLIHATLPQLTEKTSSQLRKNLPDVSSISNPLDITGEALAKDYETALASFVENPDIASIIVILTPQTMTQVEETASVLAKFEAAKKPILASFLGDKLVQKGVEILRRSRVPHFDDPEKAVRAIDVVTKYWHKFYISSDFIELTQGDRGAKYDGDALELVSRYNVPIPPSGFATNMDISMKIVGRIGFPVAIKNISKKFVHKYKSGKVVLNVQSEAFAKQTIQKIGFPVLIQRMVESPFEIIVGAKRDEKLGVILTFGWGGVFTEDIEDISTRILPLTEFDLDEMIEGTKIGNILIKENIDLSGIKNIIVEVAQIMTDFPEIVEMDLNPIKITEEGAVCVDARYK